MVKSAILRRAEKALLKSVAKPDVFLCHSRKDRALVHRLARDLEFLGIQPWLDAWEIGPGDSFLDKISDGITSSKFFGVILSRNSVGSNWCKTELREAIVRATTFGVNNILPIKYGDVDIPTFLSDKAYVDMKRYSLPGVLRISSAIYGLSPRVVEERLSGNRLAAIGDIAEFILDQTKDKRIRFGSEDWAKLTAILGEKGIQISDDIDIIDRVTGKRFPAA